MSSGTDFDLISCWFAAADDGVQPCQTENYKKYYIGKKQKWHSAGRLEAKCLVAFTFYLFIIFIPY